VQTVHQHLVDLIWFEYQGLLRNVKVSFLFQELGEPWQMLKVFPETIDKVAV